MIVFSLGFCFANVFYVWAEVVIPHHYSLADAAEQVCILINLVCFITFDSVTPTVHIIWQPSANRTKYFNLDPKRRTGTEKFEKPADDGSLREAQLVKGLNLVLYWIVLYTC